MVECGTIPRIRHVQCECLMYNSVQALYQWLNMAKYRVYDMCIVNV